MKAKFPYDDAWRNRLDQYEPEVPSHIWDNIANQSQKKRPFFLWPWNLSVWLLLLFGLGGMSVGGYYWLSGTSHADIVAKENSPSSSLNVTKTAIGNHLPVVIQNSDRIINNNTRNNDTTTAIFDDQIAEVSNPQNKISTLTTSNSNVESSSVVKEKDKIKSEKNILVKKKNHLIITTAENNNSDEDVMNQNITKRAVIASSKKVRIKKGSVATVNNDNEKNIYAEDNLEITKSEKNVSPSSFNNIDEIQLLSFRKNSSEGKIIKRDFPSFDIPCPNADLNPAWNKEYIDVYSSADYVIRQFNDTPNSGYMQMRKQSTSFSSAFSVGARYNKVFENGLSFRVGLNYSQINEKFQFVQGNIIQLQYIINANGDTIGSYESVFKRYKTSYNRYRTIDVPITMGYERMFGKCTVNLNAGVVFNAYSWNRGEVLDVNLQPVNINSADTSNPYQMRSNIGVGGIASASIYYPLNDQFKIFAEPYFRYNFSSMNSVELSLKQKYHTAGLKIGLRFDLK